METRWRIPPKSWAGRRWIASLDRPTIPRCFVECPTTCAQPDPVAGLHAEGHVPARREPGQKRVVLKHDAPVEARPETSRPPMTTAPLVGSASPARMFMIVDLPQPEWPRMQPNSPFSMS